MDRYDVIKGAAKPTSDNSYPDILQTLGWADRPVKATLLDVGCGGGHFLVNAACAGFEVYGIDADIRMILHARELVRDIDDVQKRIIHMLIGQPLPSCWPKFDYVTMFEVLEHTTDPLVAVRWCIESLKPGGWFAGSVPYKPGSKTNVMSAGLLQEIPETPEQLIVLNKHKNNFAEQDISNWLETAGLIDVMIAALEHRSKKRLLFRGRRQPI